MSSYVGPPTGEAVGSQWKWFFAFGAVLAVLGVIALLNVVDATLITTVFVGFLLVIGGIAQILGAFFQSGTTGMRLLQAPIGVLASSSGRTSSPTPLPVLSR